MPFESTIALRQARSIVLVCGHCGRGHWHEVDNPFDEAVVTEEAYCFTCDEPLCPRCDTDSV